MPKKVQQKSTSFVTIDCPGLSASLPVLTNYVSPEFVTKMKERFDNHVYSITTLRISDSRFQYKLKVCVKGQFKILMLDEEGKDVTK